MVCERSADDVRRLRHDVWMARIGLMACIIFALAGHPRDAVLLGTINYWGARLAHNDGPGVGVDPSPASPCEDCGGPGVSWEDGLILCDDCAILRAKRAQIDGCSSQENG